MATAENKDGVPSVLPVGTRADAPGDAEWIDVANKEPMLDHFLHQDGGAVRLARSALGHNAQDMRQRIERQVQVSREPDRVSRPSSAYVSRTGSEPFKPFSV